MNTKFTCKLTRSSPSGERLIGGELFGADKFNNLTQQWRVLALPGSKIIMQISRFIICRKKYIYEISQEKATRSMITSWERRSPDFNLNYLRDNEVVSLISIASNAKILEGSEPTICETSSQVHSLDWPSKSAFGGSQVWRHKGNSWWIIQEMHSIWIRVCGLCRCFLYHFCDFKPSFFLIGRFTAREKCIPSWIQL